MDNLTLLMLGLVGLVSGAFGAMLGLGGGVLMVPLLAGALGMPIHQSVAASLLGVVATSNAGAAVYLKARLANIRLGLVLEPALALGGIAGGVTATLISGRMLGGVFVLLLIYGAYSMLRKEPVEEWRDLPQIDEHVAVAGSVAVSGPLSGLVFDRARGKVLAYRVRALPQGLVLALVAGNLGGLLGIGGGLIKVPVLHLVMGLPMKASVATSNFAMGITSSAAAFVYFSRGLIDPYVAAPLIVGVVVGAQIGSRVAQRIDTAALKRVFVLVLLLMAAQMALKVLEVRF